MAEVLVLAEKDIDQFLSMEEAIEAVEDSLAEYDSGATLMPHKLHLDIPKTGGFMRVMPAAIPKIGFAGVKMYLDPSYSDVSSAASFMLFEIGSGRPVALFGANRMSQIRTGAASAVASKYLARKDSRVAGIFGSGRHARTQLEGTCTVRKIDEAKVYSPTREHRESFATEMSMKLGIKVTAVDSPHRCAESADVLNLATTTKTPVVHEDDVEKGMHINTIGSSFPGRSEIDPRVFLKSKVVVDCRDQALGGVEGSELASLIGKGLMKPSDIYAEIGEVILGRKKGRTSEKEITLFKNTGMAIWDVACAARVYEKARKEKGWKRIEI